MFTLGVPSSLQTAPAGMVCADGNIVSSNAGLCGTAHRCIGTREGGGQVPEGEVPCPGGGGRRVAAQPASFGARRLGDGGFPAYWTGSGVNVWQTVVAGWRTVSGTIINETCECASAQRERVVAFADAACKIALQHNLRFICPSCSCERDLDLPQQHVVQRHQHDVVPRRRPVALSNALDDTHAASNAVAHACLRLNGHRVRRTTGRSRRSYIAHERWHSCVALHVVLPAVLGGQPLLDAGDCVGHRVLPQRNHQRIVIHLPSGCLERACFRVACNASVILTDSDCLNDACLCDAVRYPSLYFGQHYAIPGLRPVPVAERRRLRCRLRRRVPRLH